MAAGTGLDVSERLGRTRARAANAVAFTEAYRRYYWPTDGGPHRKTHELFTDRT